MKNRLLIATSLALSLAACGESSTESTSSTQTENAEPVASDCGKVTIAEMNWSSASLMAHVDRYILEHGFGCDAQLVTGDTMPTSTSMIEKSEPDIAPELWSNGIREPLDKGVEEGRLKYAGHSLADGGEEGLWVPQYMVDEDPSLATLEGVKAHAKMFKHAEDPDASMVMGCPAGWNCHITVKNLYKALELEEAGFKLVDPGSGAALAGSIAKAYERKEPWFGYYWSPTAVLGKYQMVKVDFGSGVDADHYNNCLTQEDCEDPKPSMWPPSAAEAVTTTAFADRAPEAFAYIAKRSYTNIKMNGLLAWMEDNQADGATGANYFLSNDEATWSAWLSPEIAKKVKMSLAEK